MKVTVDTKRLLHLGILLIVTHVLGQYLMTNYEWTFLSAYGFSCSLSCQMSNALLKVLEGGIVNHGNGGWDGDGDGDSNQKSTTQIKKEGNRKKKKK